MARTIITGTVEFQNELTGKFMDRRVRFEADSEDAWVDIVDAAVEHAELQVNFPKGSWVVTGADTLSEGTVN